MIPISIFRKEKIKTLHLAFIECVKSGFIYPDVIEDIFQIIHKDRLVLTLSDLIEYSIVELDDIFGGLKLTKDYYLLHNNFSEILAIRNTDKTLADKNTDLYKLLLELDMDHPNFIGEIINLKK